MSVSRKSKQNHKAQAGVLTNSTQASMPTNHSGKRFVDYDIEEEKIFSCKTKILA